MAESVRCPGCGAGLPAGAPEGLCPRCVLSQGLKSGSSAPAGGAVPTGAYAGGDFQPPAPEELNAIFPQLEVLELLGQGGMGAVYKARQRELDRLVAVKILPPDRAEAPGFSGRFTREARALAKLNHPHIVTVHEFGQAGGLFYLVMEYVDGVNLRQALRGGRLRPEEALKIVPQVCDALQYAHEEGVVHRDIKPENILLDRKGRVKIADFGLAKLLGHTEEAGTLTGAHQVMGTPRYMAPEQMVGSHDVDHRADIYSLGVVFYEMLTGELPLGRFPPPSQKVQVDVRLDEVVLRALEKEPEQRYQQVSEVKTRVEALLKQPPAPPVLTALPADGPAPRRPLTVPVLGWLNLLAAFVMLLLGSLVFIPSDDPTDPFERALRENAFYRAYYWSSAVAGYVSSAVLLAGGVGLLLWQPWARRLTLAWCVFQLALFVVETPFLFRYDLPLLSELMAQGNEADDTAWVGAAAVALVILGLLVFLVCWAVLQLILLNRPAVVAAFVALPAGRSARLPGRGHAGPVSAAPRPSARAADST